MRSQIKNKGNNLKSNEMTEEEQYEKNLYARWNRTEECKMLKKYAGQPIENVPEEYRDKIKQLREYGLGLFPKKISSASLGKATYMGGIKAQEKLDEAQDVLKQVIEAERTKEGGKSL